MEQKVNISRLLDNAKNDIANRPKDLNAPNNIKLIPRNNEVVDPRKKEPTM